MSRVWLRAGQGRGPGPFGSYPLGSMPEMLGDDMMPNKHSFNLCPKSHEKVENIKHGSRSMFVSDAILAFKGIDSYYPARYYPPRPPIWRVILSRIWP